MKNILSLFSTKKKIMTREEAAQLLKTTPSLLAQFEQEYQNIQDQTREMDDFPKNAKEAAEKKEGLLPDEGTDMQDIISRIVRELASDTYVWKFDGEKILETNGLPEKEERPVTKEEILSLEKSLRPQLTGQYMVRDIDAPSYESLLFFYKKFLEEKNPAKKKELYGHFRHGLDVLDLDAITYQILGQNKNNMGNWLPQITRAAMDTGFFKIPKTTFIKVPIPMLQLARVIPYENLTRTTLDIVDEYCKKVFALELDKEYFIKTGIFSSKYDFRNAHVHGAKEVQELGEYLLFINHQTCLMAAPWNKPAFYGMNTTNEWCVREYISPEIPENMDSYPYIYHGLPLRPEYRIFVDFDTKEVIGTNPYWDPDVMKDRFDNWEDSDHPDHAHDSVIYRMCEEELMKQYHKNIETIKKEVECLIRHTEGLSGQYSIDIMQNGNDFWLIDMAVARESALIECVPKEKLKPVEENWIPALENPKA